MPSTTHSISNPRSIVSKSYSSNLTSSTSLPELSTQLPRLGSCSSVSYQPNLPNHWLSTPDKVYSCKTDDSNKLSSLHMLQSADSLLQTALSSDDEALLSKQTEVLVDSAELESIYPQERVLTDAVHSIDIQDGNPFAMTDPQWSLASHYHTFPALLDMTSMSSLATDNTYGATATNTVASQESLPMSACSHDIHTMNSDYHCISQTCELDRSQHLMSTNQQLIPYVNGAASLDLQSTQLSQQLSSSSTPLLLESRRLHLSNPNASIPSSYRDKISVIQAISHAITNSIGIGFLMLPYAFSLSGWIVGILAILLTGSLVHWVSQLVSRCVLLFDRHRRSPHQAIRILHTSSEIYATEMSLLLALNINPSHFKFGCIHVSTMAPLVKHILGRPTWLVFNIMDGLLKLGSCILMAVVSSMLILETCSHPLSKLHTDPESVCWIQIPFMMTPISIDQTWSKFMLSILVFPLLLMPFHRLRMFTSIIGMVSITIAFMCVISGMIYCIINEIEQGNSMNKVMDDAFQRVLDQTTIWPTNLSNVMQSTLIILLSFMTHDIYPDLQREMHTPIRFKRVVSISVQSVMVMDLVFAVSGYAFYGNKSMKLVTGNFIQELGGHTYIMSIAIVMLAINVMCRYAMGTHSVCTWIETVMATRRNRHESHENRNSYEDQECRHQCHAGVRGSILIGMTCLVALGLDIQWIVTSVSTLGLGVGIVIPIMCYVRLFCLIP
ncbi:hypothetical protein BDV3_001585 [Batrachochytrium dendrobatidis]